MFWNLLWFCCLLSPLLGEARRKADPTVIAPTLPPCGYNQVFLECGPPCDTECATLGQPCDRVNKRCPEGCYCVDGFARNSVGNCVPYEQCS